MDLFYSAMTFLDLVFSGYDFMVVVFLLCLAMRTLHQRRKSTPAQMEKRKQKQNCMEQSMRKPSKASSADSECDHPSDDSTVASENERKAAMTKARENGNATKTMVQCTDEAPPNPGKQNSIANANAQHFLVAVWNRTQHPPVDLAKQVFKMLTSCNIAASADTYELLAYIAIEGESLDMATEMSILMEKHTGRSLKPELLDKMVDFHITAAQNCSQTKKTLKTKELLEQSAAELTSHPWFGITKGRPQKHQIFVGAENRFYCLSITGEASPVFDVYDLNWGGPDGKTLYWGNSSDGVKVISTCAEIEEGYLKWDGPGALGWGWFASAYCKGLPPSWIKA